MDFAETWAAFCALERTLGPTGDAVEAWRRGRERYAVWALRITDRVVREMLAAVADRLAGSPAGSIILVPPDDAHVTVWVCGFPAAAPVLDDDVGESILAAQRRAIASVAPPRLLVGAPNAFATCAFLEVLDPHGDLAALRAALAVPGAREIRFSRYLPHMTVGRFGDTRPAAPIARALATLRAGGRFAPRPVHDGALELVELDARAPDRLITVWRAAAT